MGFAAALVALGAAVALQGSGTPASPQRAAELVRAMSERQLSTIAAADPSAEGWFVAAMHIPGSQLLVIRAEYAAPSLLRERILRGDFQAVYLDLHAAGALDGRLFVIDSGADGLQVQPAPNRPFDIVWRDGREQTTLNGEWKDQKMTKEEYHKRFADHDAAYAGMLDLLAASLKQTP